MSDNWGWEDGSLNYDYGCGKWPELFTASLAEVGVRNYHWDPHHETDVETEPDNVKYSGSGPDTVTCNNVLNVVDRQTQHRILSEIQDVAGPNTVVYFCVYEGDRSGVPKRTRDGYQAHTKAVDYTPVIGAYFMDVQRKGNVFRCTNPLTF